MKKLLFCLVGLLALCAGAGADGKETVTSNPAVLPGVAQQFLKKHFSTLGIRQIKTEGGIAGREYEVKLAGGCEVEFNRKGEWQKIDCKQTAVPASVIPSRIAQFVTTHYPAQIIVSIEKDDGGYEVELSDDTDLKFNARGDVREID